LFGLAAAVTLTTTRPYPAIAGEPQAVGGYLPPSGVEDFVKFVPDKQKTPVRVF
jgi:hypothetical protein